MDIAERRHHQRRRRDRIGELVERGALLVLVVLYFVGFRADEHRSAAIQEGRQTSQAVFCATSSAVIDAGRSIITGGLPKPGAPETPLERNLEKLGYPSRAERRAAAETAAQAYGDKIARAVRAEVHVKGIVRPDGTLNCRVLAGVTGTS